MWYHLALLLQLRHFIILANLSFKFQTLSGLGVLLLFRWHPLKDINKVWIWRKIDLYLQGRAVGVWWFLLSQASGTAPSSVFTKVNAQSKLAVLCAGVIFCLKYLPWSGQLDKSCLNIERYYMLLSNFIHRLWAFMYINTIPMNFSVFKKIFFALENCKSLGFKSLHFKKYIFRFIFFICIFLIILWKLFIFLWICKRVIHMLWKSIIYLSCKLYVENIFPTLLFVF